MKPHSKRKKKLLKIRLQLSLRLLQEKILIVPETLMRRRKKKLMRRRKKVKIKKNPTTHIANLARIIPILMNSQKKI